MMRLLHHGNGSNGVMYGESKKPYVITVCSGKGGVGKSVIAANLASTLSGSVNTLVWDANMHFPNQHLLYGVEPPVRLNEVYSGKIAPATALYQVSDGLFLLAGMPALPIHGADYPSIFQNIFEDLASANFFDVIIIDNPAGYSEEVITCCSFSDLTVIVITDEPTSLLDGYALIKIFLSNLSGYKIKLVVNNAIDNEDAEDVSKKLNLASQKFLGMSFDVIGFIPYDRVVRQSIMHQELFTITDPCSEVSKSVANVSGYVLENIQKMSKIELE